VSARSLAAVALFCLFPALSHSQARLNLPQWLQKDIVDRIKVSGYRNLSYHNHRVTGDGEAFGQGNYGGQGNKEFTDFGHVRVSGQDVLGSINFDFVIQDSRFQDPQGQKFSIDYDRGPWLINLGDIRGSVLNTNRFATFTKTLNGASLGYESGAFRAKTVFSDVKGAPRTVTIPGTNTAGPYYLQSSQIVRGSERIEVDGMPQTLGQDYIINYEIGSITFVNRSTGEAKIIPPTSTIVASYEVFGFSGSRGRVQAAGVAYSFFDFVTLGITGMQQIKGGSGGLSTRLEKFQGFGPPSTPYFLQFEPLATEPIVIRVNGILQTEGVDYFFDPDNPSIFYFTRFMPATDNIDVLYTPKPTSTVDGDREVLGWDLNFPLGKDGKSGSLKYSEATGKLMNTPTPSSGTSRGVDLRYGHGPLTFVGSARNIPRGYVNVETVGFSRNEVAYDTRLTYAPPGFFSYTLASMNAAVSTRTLDSFGNTVFQNSRFTKFGATGSYTPLGGNMPLNLGFSRTKSRNALGETALSTTDLSTSKTGKNWSTRLSLQHLDAQGPVNSGSGATLQNVSLNTIQLNTDFRPSDRWTMSLNTGLSQVRTDDEDGLGRDIQGSLRWKPDDRFEASFIMQDSDAGQLATLGQFSNGYGSGYGGSGFSSGTGSSALTSASNVRQYRLQGLWSPYSGLSLGARAYTRESSGSFSSNTRTTGVGLDASWAVTNFMNLQTSIDTSRTEFLGTPTTSASTVLSAYLDGAPPGPWSWHLGYNLLVSGGGLFEQTSTSFDGALGFRLSKRQALSLTLYSTSGTGQFAQEDFDFALAYRYQIWRSMALQGSYRFRNVDNLDPLVTSGAYRSSGFDLELVFNFGS
jgi:hypothetical protein